MTQVHAPYHFVPVSHWVYMPEWAHLVSHDHPFKDGISGKLTFKISNTTPLCIGHEKGKDGVLKLVRNAQGRPIIPQTTLKGMIRNVIEIASFGKLNVVNDRQFSYRDISNSRGDYLTNIIRKNDVLAGWIKYNTEHRQWEFYACDHTKIHHTDINRAKSCSLKNEQAAVDKYETLPLTTSLSARISAPRGTQKNRWAEEIGQGGVEGNAIFTNARIINNRKKPESYEFSYFFYNTATSPKFIAIDKHVQNLFSNHNEEQVNYLKHHPHPQHGIPVFALVEKNGKLHSLGFAKMPRVSYKHSIRDMINNANPAHSSEAYFDMAELMFGTLREHDLSLKSRVHFNDAVIQEDHYQDSIYEAPATVLGEPKATFLGAYIEQQQSQQYDSYNNAEASLAGWKRYPARNAYQNHAPTNSNENVQSRFELLKEGHTFEGQVVFHNLKQIELAALVWGLTLGDSPYQRHTVGHAKSLGAGTISLKIVEDRCLLRANCDQTNSTIQVNKLVEHFEEHMNLQYPQQGKWKESPQIAYLYALTDEDIENYNDFRYMELKQFEDVKKNVMSLPNIEHNGQTLSRLEHVFDVQGSATFGKGRLSALVTNSEFDKAQIELTTQFAVKQQKAAEKAQLAKEKSALDKADISELDKCLKRLELLTANQTEITRTEQKSRTNELRECLKSVKTIELSNHDAQALLSRFNDIKFSDQVVKKAVKYLEKQV